jgi:murein DD-endopeptidase MepM/ murein hydrolase activator NlpD
MKIKILKQKQRKNKYLLSLLIAAMIFSYMGYPAVVGQSADELAKQKQEKQQKLFEVQQKISQLQTEIKQKSALTKTLKNELAIINLEIAETKAKLEETTQQIDVTNLEIADVTDKIIKTEADIQSQKELLKELIAEINDMDRRSPLEIALENDNFAEFLDQLQYTTSIQERSQEVLTQIKKLKSDLELRQAELKKQKGDLDNLRESYRLSEAGLNGQQLAKQQILDQTRGQERTYQKLLAESQGLQTQINQEIFDLETQIRAKLGNKKLASIKGLLAWPMDGVLTQGYGNTGFTALGYNYHNGIDIAAAPGTQIYSAADGVVADTGTGTGAYGNWVTVRHTIQTKVGPRELITLYAHMSSFRVKKGQELKQGDLIGFEGNTGNTTRLLYGPNRGYHIHFGVMDADGYGVSEGKYTNIYGAYRIPYGATYNPLDFL